MLLAGLIFSSKNAKNYALFPRKTKVLIRFEADFPGIDKTDEADSEMTVCNDM